MAVRQLCQLCAARVTWYSFHSYTSDAALLCSQCSRGRCPNGHTHAAKFATASSVIKSENDKKIAARQRLQDVSEKQIQKWKGPSSPDSNCMRSSFSKGKRSYRPKAPPLRSRWHWHGDHPKAPLSDRRGIGMLHTTQRYNEKDIRSERDPLSSFYLWHGRRVCRKHSKIWRVPLVIYM